MRFVRPLSANPRACGILAGPLAGILLTACAGSGGSAMVGLPAEEFDRAYAAGYDVAAAERCGAAVDAGHIRHALVEDVKRRGADPTVADKAGRAFDKTRSEFTGKLQARPDYCVTEYAVPPERLAQYNKGEFSAAR
jgi:hypothetical protein